MGYSCTAKASFVREALEDLIANLVGPGKPSNAMPSGGFWEIGRERPDGAITGQVWKDAPDKPGYCRKAGSFRICPDGKIARFPGLPPAVKQSAEIIGANKFQSVFGGAK